MDRIGVALLLLTATLCAEGRYERLLDEAIRLRLEHRPGEPPDQPIVRAFNKFGEAIQADPNRFEAYELRGLNRVEYVRTASIMLEDRINSLRAQGAPADVVEKTREGGERVIQASVEFARDEFKRAYERMYRSTGQVDPQRQTFAVAALKYAQKQYLRGLDGQTGAIDDWKKLVQAGFRREHCAEFIARCYNELAREAFTDGEYEKAQEFWDKGLNWAQQQSTKELIYTNKAAALEQDNEFAHAEEILEKQIEREPYRAGHWKNLGLVLGYQNKLRRALHAYKQSRDLCYKTKAPFFLGLLHGNAWLKGAMIHGKLLEDDGDLRLAWQLFMQYRRMLGDDYNFSFNFGDFCFHLRQYDLAWTYLNHARNLQPYCPGTYQLLLQVAPRTAGTREEVDARTQQAKADWQAAQDQFSTRTENPAVARACGGHADRQLAGPNTGPRLLDPNPLEGFDEENPPDWIEAAAAQRRPFVAWTPESEAEEETSAAPAGDGRALSVPLWAIGAGLLVLVAGAIFFLGRRRAA